jgi:hypothetical protein
VAVLDVEITRGWKPRVSVHRGTEIDTQSFFFQTVHLQNLANKRGNQVPEANASKQRMSEYPTASDATPFDMMTADVQDEYDNATMWGLCGIKSKNG